MKTLFFKPFEKYSEKKLITVGIASFLVGTFLGFWFQVFFYGGFKLYFPQNIPLQSVFLSNIIIVFSYTLFLFFAAKYLNRKTRAIDILTTVLIALIPLYLLTLQNSNGFMFKATEQLKSQLPAILEDPNNFEPVQMDNLFIIIAIGLLTFALLIWCVVLLYNGFKIAANAKGIKSIFIFSIGIILAEVLSRFLISFLIDLQL